MFIIPVEEVKAKTLQDLYNELASLEAEYNKANSSKKLTNEEIKKLESEIASVAARVQEAKNEIVQAEEDIKESEDKIEQKKEETNELLKFLQVSTGENVYLEYLFEAEDYTDFIYRYAVVTQLSSYNNQLVTELEDLIKELEEKKVNLSNKQAQLEAESVSLIQKNNTLKANLTELTELGTTIEEDIKDLKESIEDYESRGCSRNQDITTCNSTPYARGFKYPLTMGCVTSEYTGYNQRTDWSGGGGHHGIDLSCVPEGTNVYATAAGVVERVVYESSCGGNMVFIYHNVSGQPYTSVYMHLLSIAVYKGQVVSDETIIGRMGGGSTASYDGCTGGAHLHFGLAYGHNAYNFNAYSFNPRNIFYFPALYGGYFYR